MITSDPKLHSNTGAGVALFHRGMSLCVSKSIGLISIMGRFSGFVLTGLLVIVASKAAAYDCSRIAPFEPFETQSVAITVDRTYWAEEQGQVVEKTERVCETAQALDIGAYDIRGREDEWYYCFYQEPRPMLECKTQLQGEAARIIVRPATVIRGWVSQDARDTHAHIFIFPESDSSRMSDTFVRSLSFDLKNRSILLDSTSGGRSPQAKQDSFSIRLLFQ